MIDIQALFEGHLTVTDLQRSMSFFGDTLRLELAEVFWERRAAFYWVGKRVGRCSVCGRLEPALKG